MSKKTPWWRGDMFAKRIENLHRRDKMTRAVRQFFYERDFAEPETPALQVSPGMEPHIMAFATDIAEPGEAMRRFYLHTSPEFAMKKLLVAGLPRIFQICHTYRNGERSSTHHPEFSMIEWYRAGATYEDLMEDCEGLLRAAATGAGTKTLRYRGRASDPFQPFTRLSVAESFHEYCKIDILAEVGNAEALWQEAIRVGIAPHVGDSWEDIYFRIFQDIIEPKLGDGAPCILYDYPISMAALSRPKASDPRLAERFEIYVCGLELANAFGELTNAKEQRRRFEEDMALKEKLYGFRYPIDEDFLAALEEGMPESSGIALGMDRLAMLCCGADHIDDVLWAPVA
ncbi:MAG TPA: EF-P lysine aminoacylase GenX [Rhodospirillaceae bacterium]|nr:MAG: EF-P lysine aminoacylase GenX [Alphaproteobacteria bacterium GWF2_58_20]HAU29113.1 EF-P lysine aminoacylase GenX [Rhodospirillaceae bacterium]